MPIFLLPAAPNAEGIFSLKEQDLHHLKNVLRVKVGGVFQAALTSGQKIQARLIENNKSYYGKIEKYFDHFLNTQALPLWLGVGMIPWKRMEWLVGKATELGVQRLTPLFLEYSKFSVKKTYSQAKWQRLQKIAEETVKQCEQIPILQVDPAMTLQDWMEALEKKAMTKMVLDEKIEQPRLQVSDLSLKSEYAVLIGPEGGLSSLERQLAADHQFKKYSLGKKILKTETAALYLSSLCDAAQSKVID